MTRGRIALPALLLMLLALGAAAGGAQAGIPPAPAQWATDTAGFLKPQTVADLDARLRAYQYRTGHQILVYVTPTTGTTATEDWTVRAFARWKVGRKGLDDGLVLFVFPADRKVRIEVGYGLEQSVPDAAAARIIRDTIAPAIRAGQPDAGVVTGVDEILAAVGGTPSTAAPATAVPRTADDPSGKAGTASNGAPLPLPAPDAPDPGEKWGVAIGILFGLLIAVGLPVLLFRLPTKPDTYVSSGHYDGGGWGLGGLLLGGALGAIGGGGFSGGGGLSGGGGATGSW